MYIISVYVGIANMRILLERMAEVQEQVLRRHGAAREKVLAHPVVVAVLYMYMYMYVCMYVCMYACVCVYVKK